MTRDPGLSTRSSQHERAREARAREAAEPSQFFCAERKASGARAAFSRAAAQRSPSRGSEQRARKAVGSVADESRERAQKTGRVRSRSGTLVYSGGADIYVAHPDTTWFAVFGRGFLFGLPVPVLLFAALAVALGVLLHMTAFGRKIFAIGGNETAAAFSGIDTRKTVALAYLIGGLTTSVAALIIASRVMGAQANTGDGYELDVISAVILGGTSFLGGSGTMAGTVVGVVLLAFMQNGLLLLGLPYYIQWIITWGVIISAVWVEMAAKRKRILL